MINFNSFIDEYIKIAAEVSPSVQGHPLFAHATPMPAVPGNSPEGNMQQLHQQKQQNDMAMQQQAMAGQKAPGAAKKPGEKKSEKKDGKKDDKGSKVEVTVNVNGKSEKPKSKEKKASKKGERSGNVLGGFLGLAGTNRSVRAYQKFYGKKPSLKYLPLLIAGTTAGAYTGGKFGKQFDKESSVKLSFFKEYARHAALNLGQAAHDVTNFLDHPDAEKMGPPKSLKRRVASGVNRVPSIGSNLWFASLPPQLHHTEEELKDLMDDGLDVKGEFLNGYNPEKYPLPKKKKASSQLIPKVSPLPKRARKTDTNFNAPDGRVYASSQDIIGD